MKVITVGELKVGDIYKIRDGGVARVVSLKLEKMGISEVVAKCTINPDNLGTRWNWNREVYLEDKVTVLEENELDLYLLGS